MRLLFENWRKFVNEQGQNAPHEPHEMPPGLPAPGNVEVPPWDDHLHPDNKYYIKEGDSVVWLGDEFSEEEVDLLRNSVSDYMKAYDAERLNDIHALNDTYVAKQRLESRLRNLKRTPAEEQVIYPTPRRPRTGRRQHRTIGPGLRSSHPDVGPV